jgi:hypothetical protein
MPIPVDGVTVRSLVHDRLSSRRVQAGSFAYLQQYRLAGDVFASLEIRQENGLVKGVSASLILGPFSQFLRQTTVEGHRTLTKGQVEFAGHLAQAGQHAGNVYRLPGKQGF